MQGTVRAKQWTVATAKLNLNAAHGHVLRTWHSVALLPATVLPVCTPVHLATVRS